MDNACKTHVSINARADAILLKARQRVFDGV